MSIWDRFRDNSKQLAEAQREIDVLHREVEIKQFNTDLFTERLAELEIQLEDQGWQVLTGVGSREFSRNGLRIINGLARIYFLKNPLIKRAVMTQTQYVFGRGINISARHPKVNDIIQEFIDDPKNKAEFTEHQSIQIKETELQCFANIFFVFFVNKYNGHVRIRTINMDEVTEIITNPEDSKEPWFYHRVWSQTNFERDLGPTMATVKEAYYPDWRYMPKNNERPDTINGHPVMWDNPVYHVSVNRLSDMLFGVSELYAAMDWSKAYKEFLENWATIVKAHSRFAWDLTTKGGATGVANAKSKIGTTLTSSSSETNPPPAPASTFIHTDGIELKPQKTGGAVTKAVDGRQIRLMVSSGTGIYEHYLTGDPSTGNLATAKAMELPMLIMFEDRRHLWTSVIIEIMNFVIKEAVRAGRIPGRVIINDQGDEIFILDNDTENDDIDKQDKPIDYTIDVEYGSILEDVETRIKAIVSAVTLDGKSPAGTIPDMKLVTRLLLTALGLDDIDAILDDLFPEETEPADGEEKPPQEPVPPEEEDVAFMASAFSSSLKKLHQRIDEAINAIDYR